MADVFTTEKRSAVMARIRSRGNRDTELRMILLFRIHGLTVCVRPSATLSVVDRDTVGH